MYLPVYQISSGSRTRRRNSIVSGARNGRSWTAATIRGWRWSFMPPCLYKLSSIRSFRFPVGKGRAPTHTHTHARSCASWAEIKRGIYSVSALCNRKTGSRFVARFEGKSRGGRRLVIACTTRNKNTAARRRRNGNFLAELSPPKPPPSPPLVAVQIRSN